MNKFIVVLLTVISIFTMILPDAEAGRMGGSRSIGRQSSNVTRQQAPAKPQPAGTNQATPPATPAATPAGAPVKPASPWKGMLGGALLGLGLGALLSSMGIGGGMASMISMILMLGIGIFLVMFLLRLFRQKTNSVSEVNNAYAGSTNFSATPEIGSRINDVERNEKNAEPSFGTSAVSMEPGATWEIPADFDVAAFERAAKTYFIRLQAAWDKADINDIREFTTPEMYAEIKLQIQERGATNSVTDVITINAKLLGIETLGADYLASIKFVGTLKEDANAPTESFEEVWNLSKPVKGNSGWLLAGIQQIN